MLYNHGLYSSNLHVHNTKIFKSIENVDLVNLSSK